MAAAFQQYKFCPRNHFRELLGKIGRGQAIILCADDQRRGLDFPKLCRPVGCKAGVQSAGGNLGRWKAGQGLSNLLLPSFPITDYRSRITWIPGTISFRGFRYSLSLGKILSRPTSVSSLPATAEYDVSLSCVAMGKIGFLK